MPEKLFSHLPIQSHGLMNVPYNLPAVPLLFLLRTDLNLETADLTVQTLGRATDLHAVRTDFRGFGNGQLSNREKQAIYIKYK